VSILGLIPARAGSKRLPGKALIPLDGLPLIAHTCIAARESGVLAAIYVNTDSAEIAEVAGQFGAEAPTLRPAHLAADDTPTRDSNLFLLDHLRRRGEQYDAIMVLQPTSPLRTPGDVQAAARLFENHAPCEVMSVSPVTPNSWLGTVAAAGRFDRWAGDEIVYRLNGAIYVHRWDDYVSGRPAAKTIAHRMPASRGVDIDTREDLDWAEFLLQRTRQTAVA